MARGRKKAEPTEASNNLVAAASEEMRDQLEKTVLKEYSNLFTKMPDRRNNLFEVNIPGLNYILGGGLPRGQIVHIYGPEGSGKTTLVMHIIASIQAQGGRALVLDSENSMDSNVATGIGINVDAVRYMKDLPNGEIALDIGEKAIRANLCDCLVYDSVAALSPAAILEGSNMDKHVADKARMLSTALEKLNNAAVNSNAIIVFVNQLRANIQTGYGVRPFTTPGGKALPFYANVNIYVARVGPIKEGDKIIGQQVKLKVEKNKIAPPMRETICNLIYGQGFRRDMDLILSAKDKGILTLKGSWVEYNGERIGQGLPSAVEYAKAHPEFLDDLEGKLYGETTAANPADADQHIDSELPATADGDEQS